MSRFVSIVEEGAMEPQEKPQDDPFAVGQITERLPAWETWEDEIEPAEEEPIRHERAA